MPHRMSQRPHLRWRGAPQHRRRVLALVADAGAALLEAGSEVARVEDTMQRLAAAYGIVPTAVVVFPTALFIEAVETGETAMRRVSLGALNLAVLEAVNQLSRDAARHPPELEAFRFALRQAARTSRYSWWSTVWAAGFAAFWISGILGGTWHDMLVSAVAGAWTRTCRVGLARLPFFAGSLGDLVAASMAVVPALVCSMLPGPWQPGIVLVSAILVLTPGMLLIIAIRDGISGDLLAAGGRLLGALLVGVAVAAGASLSLSVFIGAGGRWP